VYTFGYYLREMIANTRSKRAIPLLVSQTPTYSWNTKTNKLVRNDRYSGWIEDTAQLEKTALLDMFNLTADYYDSVGSTATKKFFPLDNTHTSPEGANLESSHLIAAIKCVNIAPLVADLSSLGKQVTPKCDDSFP